MFVCLGISEGNAFWGHRQALPVVEVYFGWIQKNPKQDTSRWIRDFCVSAPSDGRTDGAIECIKKTNKKVRFMFRLQNCFDEAVGLVGCLAEESEPTRPAVQWDEAGRMNKQSPHRNLHTPAVFKLMNTSVVTNQDKMAQDWGSATVFSPDEPSVYKSFSWGPMFQTTKWIMSQDFLLSYVKLYVFSVSLVCRNLSKSGILLLLPSVIHFQKTYFSLFLAQTGSWKFRKWKLCGKPEETLK